MELAQIKDTMKTQPFRPSTMRMVDGREFFVPHPEFLFIPPNMRHTVLLANTATQAVTILDAVMIASISFTENGKRDDSHPSGNGADGNGV
jgi:hypothetical protein